MSRCSLVFFVFSILCLMTPTFAAFGGTMFGINPRVSSRLRSKEPWTMPPRNEPPEVPMVLFEKSQPDLSDRQFFVPDYLVETEPIDQRDQDDDPRDDSEAMADFVNRNPFWLATR